MAHTKINTQVIPDGTIVSADLTMPITGFSSTGIDDNANNKAVSLASNGTVTIDPAGSQQVTHELSVREATSPRITIDDINGTATGVNAGLLLRYGTTNAGVLSYSEGADLGLNNNLNGDLVFSTNGGTRMTVDSSGNVGIGGTPGTALDVVGSGDAIRVRDTGAHACTATMLSAPNYAYLQLARNSGVNTSRAELRALGNQAQLELENQTSDIASIVQDSASEFAFTMGTAAAARMTFNTGTSEAVRITQAGNVGIGDSIPTEVLCIEALTNPRLKITDTGNWVSSMGVEGSTGALTFENVDGTERMRIDASGRVLINQTAHDEGLNLEVMAPTGFSVGSGFHSPSTQSTISFKDSTTTADYKVRVGSMGDDLLLFAGGSERMRIDASGNVGIGTAAPDSKLHVSGGINTGPATAGSTDAALIVSNVDDAYGIHMNVSASTGAGFISAQRNDGTATGYDLVLQPNAGNVGIGVSDPSSVISSSKVLEVASSGNTTLSVTSADTVNDRNAILELLSSGNGNSKSIILYGDTDTTPSSPSPLVFEGYHSGARTEHMRITSAGNVSIGTSSTASALFKTDIKGSSTGNFQALRLFNSSDGASATTDLSLCLNRTGSEVLGVAGSIRAGKEQAWTTAPSTVDGYLSFSTVQNEALAERMRITSAGEILFGKALVGVSTVGTEIRPAAGVYSSIASGANSYHVYNTTSPAFTFYVSAAGTINAVNTTISALSDERLKENVRDLDDGLSKIMQLQPRKFDWKEGQGRNISDDRGFIAQEFETVFPDMVHSDGLNTDSDGESYKAVCANLVPTLVKSIQEQQAMIETLQAELTALKGE